MMSQRSFIEMDWNFGPAKLGEPTVFGAAAPGGSVLSARSERDVRCWLDLLRTRGIRRVCCLLTDHELQRWEGLDLLALYRSELGEDRVLHAPVAGNVTCSERLFLRKILPFLWTAERADDRVLVHCMAGVCRTGQVLAAWLVAARRCYPVQAVDAVTSTRAWRNPLEAPDGNGLAFLSGVALAIRPRE
jgi:protein-tyrosine phosphatase